MPDIYNSFGKLAAKEAEGSDFRIVIGKGHSSLAIIAPHAGRIERHTSVIARHIAGTDHWLYLFEGCKPSQNGSLHITSERFDEPQCLELVGRSRMAVGVHGAAGEEDFVIVGGRNARAKTLVLEALRRFGATAHGETHLLGLSPNNICNRASNGGVQLEISSGLRNKLVGANPHSETPLLAEFAAACRKALADYELEAGN